MRARRPRGPSPVRFARRVRTDRDRETLGAGENIAEAKKQQLDVANVDPARPVCT